MADTKLLDEQGSFEPFGLDTRLLRAVARMNFSKPTLVQATAIPLALEGKDILAKARTGSGKTAAYSLPILQGILTKKDNGEPSRVRSIILVPTRELAEQVTGHIEALAEYCTKEIKVLNLAGAASIQQQQPMLAENPDIVIATPSKVISHMEAKNLDVRETLDTLVIDEADLILSYGYDEDLRRMLGFLPKIFQTFLMSATFTKDVDNLKQLVVRNPAVLKLEEEADETENLTQYVVKCSENEKFLLTYVILKLKLIKGKCILFVNDIDRCYRLKLFLEQFSIRSCVLNSELPLNSRQHIVEEFNKGIYDYLIATDESELKGEQDTDSEESDQESEDEQTGDASGKRQSKATQKAKRKHKKDNEYGVSRGVDFHGVAAVINFDFPKSAKSYTHRVGRTARGGRKGMSLSFVVTQAQIAKRGDRDKAISRGKDVHDEKIYNRVVKQQEARNASLKPYLFDMEQVNGFRYRLDDALRAVTRAAVQEARLKELKAEILNSEKLKAHFEDNPKDLAFLRHDKTLHPTRVQSHMKHIPSYLMPKIAGPSGGEENVGFVPYRKEQNKKRKGGPNKHQGNAKKRKNDPLRTFSVAKGSKSSKKKLERELSDAEQASQPLPPRYHMSVNSFATTAKAWGFLILTKESDDVVAFVQTSGYSICSISRKVKLAPNSWCCLVTKQIARFFEMFTR
ncbi:hypothetical protein BZG36_01467 [Bifiguratus adelaidae]|uniref:RNA helicase n=1 Tax=Bifiguratus adelaidae TaxID=1938954 RepID=A0A261Y4Q1_9FUNG|nr:hypothetical protein BZG36_01467 [Bifiguratus adelaidae]